MKNKFHKDVDYEIVTDNFFQLSKSLVFNDEYKDLPPLAKLLYTVLRDRVKLSLKNQWYDSDGFVFIKYSRESMASDLHIGSVNTISKMMKKLEELDLIEEHRLGQGKANYIYVCKPNVRFQNPKSCDSRKPKSGIQESQKVRPSNNKHSNNKINNNKKKCFVCLGNEKNQKEEIDFAIQENLNKHKDICSAIAGYIENYLKDKNINDTGNVIKNELSKYMQNQMIDSDSGKQIIFTNKECIDLVLGVIKASIYSNNFDPNKAIGGLIHKLKTSVCNTSNRKDERERILRARGKEEAIHHNTQLSSKIDEIETLRAKFIAWYNTTQTLNKNIEDFDSPLLKKAILEMTPFSSNLTANQALKYAPILMKHECLSLPPSGRRENIYMAVNRLAKIPQLLRKIENQKLVLGVLSHYELPYADIDKFFTKNKLEKLISKNYEKSCEEYESNLQILENNVKIGD